MKLSKVQVRALAENIHDRIRAPYMKHNVEISSSEEYKNFTTTNVDCIAITKIGKKYDLENSAERLIRDIKEDYFKDIFVKVPYISISSIEREIVLNTIEESSVEEIITKIMSLYPKYE